MNKEHLKGAADTGKGKIKEALGSLTDDREMETAGKVDQVKGAVHSAVGDVKDSVRDALKGR